MNRKMKDSGVEWIGEIPEDWEVSKIKYVTNELYTGATPQSENDDFYSDIGIPFVTISDMSCNDFVEVTKKSITEQGQEDKKLKILPKGTILYSIYATIGKVSELNIDACINQALLAILHNETLNKNYLKYSLKSMESYVLSQCFLSSQNNLNTSKVKNFNILIPCNEKQKLIAETLDKKCTQIDALIQNQQQQIEKLKQYKQSLITETVTKGLEPNVPMKDSGVEWIGEIPENWEVRKIKFVSSVEKELWSEKYLDKNINYIGLENIESGNGKKIETNSIYEKDKSLIYKEKDILFGKLRPYLAKVYLAKEIGCCSSEFCVIRTNTEYLSNYIWAVLISKSFIDTVNFSTYGTKMPRANTDFIKNMQIPIPPFEEQEKIATYLDKKCSQIDNLIKIKEEKIQKLNDYKKSIIYEYVTGKKEA